MHLFTEYITIDVGVSADQEKGPITGSPWSRSERADFPKEVSEFVTHLQMKPTMNFSPGVLIFLIEQFVLGIWKAMLDIFSRWDFLTWVKLAFKDTHETKTRG